MFLIREELQNITVTVEETQEIAEVMWVVISNGRVNIRVGIVYAPQENKTKLSQLKLMYKEIKNQIEKAN